MLYFRDIYSTLGFRLSWESFKILKNHLKMQRNFEKVLKIYSIELVSVGEPLNLTTELLTIQKTNKRTKKNPLMKAFPNSKESAYFSKISSPTNTFT